jgi:hypothetical protein
MATTGDNQVPDTLMSMVVGLATVIALLKTQSVMMQFSYVSMGARNARKLGGQFMNGVSYMTGKGKKVAGATNTKVTNIRNARATQRINSKAAQTATSRPYNQPRKDASGITITKRKAEKTGTTYEAPKVTPRDNVIPMKTKSVTPKNNSKDKVG